MKYSIVIELDYPGDDELLCRQIENRVGTAIQDYCLKNELIVAHLEAAAGSLHDSFGVGFKSISGSMRSGSK